MEIFENLKTIFSISLFDIEYGNILFNDIMLTFKIHLFV